MNRWIKVEEKLPESGQDVLIYYLDGGEIHQINLLEYYTKGSVMDTRVDRDPSHTYEEKIFNVLYNKDYDIIAPEDGFYIYDEDENGDPKYRRHKDCITHWMPLPIPPYSHEEEWEGYTE